jgi:hypothetical protein
MLALQVARLSIGVTVTPLPRLSTTAVPMSTQAAAAEHHNLKVPYPSYTEFYVANNPREDRSCAQV